MIENKGQQVGQQVIQLSEKRARCADLRASMWGLVSSMRAVVDASLADGGSFAPERIPVGEVPPDGWSQLAELLTEFTECKADIELIEQELVDAGYGNVIGSSARTR